MEVVEAAHFALQIFEHLLDPRETLLVLVVAIDSHARQSRGGRVRRTSADDGYWAVVTRERASLARKPALTSIVNTSMTAAVM